MARQRARRSAAGAPVANDESRREVVAAIVESGVELGPDELDPLVRYFCYSDRTARYFSAASYSLMALFGAPVAQGS
jgi:hypothetical protein